MEAVVTQMLPIHMHMYHINKAVCTKSEKLEKAKEKGTTDQPTDHQTDRRSDRESVRPTDQQTKSPTDRQRDVQSSFVATKKDGG